MYQKSRLHDKDQRMERLKQKLNDKDAQLEHLKRRLDQKDVKIRSLQETLGEAEKHQVIVAEQAEDSDRKGVMTWIRRYLIAREGSCRNIRTVSEES